MRHSRIWVLRDQGMWDVGREDIKTQGRGEVGREDLGR